MCAWGREGERERSRAATAQDLYLAIFFGYPLAMGGSALRFPAAINMQFEFPERRVHFLPFFSPPCLLSDCFSCFPSCITDFAPWSRLLALVRQPSPPLLFCCARKKGAHLGGHAGLWDFSSALGYLFMFIYFATGASNALLLSW